MSGKAVLVCQQNSHPFLDRTLILEQPVKIGRSVARARAAQNNGIFDCKVLSRNHALLCYNSGKFFLQDTKSSNGTFVNNQRLSKSGEESPPRELRSGDIVQFGVDVLENSRKVTHGCIIAIIKLYHPNGTEAKSGMINAKSLYGPIHPEELYQLHNCIKEGLQRESVLSTKIKSLSRLMDSIQNASNLTWTALITEDRLLTRVESLETQLQAHSRNFPEEKLREELRRLNEDKVLYQDTAKECLKKILEEKLEAIKKCEEIKLTLMNTETERANYEELVNQSHKELKELMLKHCDQVTRTEELEDKIQTTEYQLNEVISRLESEKEELSLKMQKLTSNEAELKERITELQSSGDSEKLDYEPYLKYVSTIINEDNTEIDSSECVQHRSKLSDSKLLMEHLYCDDERMKYISGKADSLFRRLVVAVDQTKKIKAAIEVISTQLDLFADEKNVKDLRVGELEYDIEKHSHEVSWYMQQVQSMTEQLSDLELQKEFDNHLNSSTSILELPLKEDKKEIITNEPNNTKLSFLQKEIDHLKELLIESQEKSDVAEKKMKQLQEDLDMAKISLSETIENLNSTKQKLLDAQNLKREREAIVVELKLKMNSLETLFVESAFQEKVEFQHNSINKCDEETLAHIKQEPLLLETQNKNDLEETRDQSLVVNQEMTEKTNSEVSENHLDNKTIEDFSIISQDCAMLRDTIKILESEITKLKAERLQEDLDLKSRDVEEETNACSSVNEAAPFEDADSDSSSIKISELEEELVIVKEKFMLCNDEKTRIEKEFLSLKQDYQGLCHQSYFCVPLHYIFTVALVPILIAIYVAVGMSFS